MTDAPVWQKSIERWQFCHWWQETTIPRFTAMMVLLILVLAAVLIATAASVIALRRDGYRHVPSRTAGPIDKYRFLV
jgi:hypothetical protein